MQHRAIAPHSILGNSKQNRAGSALVLSVLVIVILFGMMAFAMDIGYLTMLKSETYSAVDAGSLAAASTLSKGRDAAKTAMYDFLSRNGVDAQSSANHDKVQVDLEFGSWDAKTKAFTTTDDQSKTDAVRVTAQLLQVDSFFGRMMGKNSYVVRASAIAVSAAPMDIMLVLDLSGSMSNHGRIAALQHAAPKFVDAIQAIGGSHQIGVMGFSADPTKYNPAAEGHTGRLYTPAGLVQPSGTQVGVVESDLTKDFDKLRNVVLTNSNLTADKYDGSTGTGAAIRDAAYYLKNDSSTRQNTSKVIVLMSDGHANKPEGTADEYATQQAASAKSQKVVVHTISLGSHADSDLLKSIAASAGGSHFDAAGESAEQLKETLKKAFEDAAAATSRPALVK